MSPAGLTEAQSSSSRNRTNSVDSTFEKPSETEVGGLGSANPSTTELSVNTTIGRRVLRVFGYLLLIALILVLVGVGLCLVMLSGAAR
jgi:hypothetical protein